MENLLNPDPGLIIWTLIVFGLVLIILKKFAWKPILDSLDERDQSIQQSLDQAEKARDEMARLTSDNQKILDEAKEERAKILKEAKEASTMLVEDAKNKAKVEASKIVEDSGKEIEIQKLAALAEVKNQVGEMAIEIAQDILKKELSNKSDQEAFVSKLVDDFKLN